MSFDKDTRNLLARTVTACRRRLTEDVTDQLKGIFGLHPDGTVLQLEELTYLSSDQHAAARRLRDLLDHYQAGAVGKEADRRKAAYERLVLETAFTVLNRLAALRLCEERGLVIECVRNGTMSAGFQMFERISGGALGDRHDSYRVFLECLFDELALDLGVLFDRLTPQSAVFPSDRCLEDVLAELNRPELAHLWTEDETIGWVYQYFNPAEERKAMRDASQAPRNSRELAVRNQFFTPRYVVEFLTDNTLGRIWFEMRKGDTELTEECHYLVRRPNEVFLAPGDKPPIVPEDEADLSQEELLKRPACVEHRGKKDPRDLRVLDPACGSGHFLLYAFDLLEQIYEEAWGDPESPKSEITGRALREDFGSLDLLRRETPRLIVEHNLHGIDIDPRAVQIAALALWLRAQKTWKTLGLKADERPRILRSSIVTAEPMPGEDDMRREFTAALRPRVLGQIVDEVFEKMKLAGEAGSLLKIEEEIKDAVEAARKQWAESPRAEQLLFPGFSDSRPKQEELRFDVTGVTDERFWEETEERILDSLRDYAEGAESDGAVRRRLFAEDAARGFAFVDLCRRRYDVVLMNPPFGEQGVSARDYMDRAYPYAPHEIYCCFFQRALGVCAEGGTCGSLTSRAFLTFSTFSAFRRMVLFERQVCCLADLGRGVLDGAVVETAASVICASGPPRQRSTIFRLLKDPDKQEALRKMIRAKSGENVFSVTQSVFLEIPGAPFCYWSGRLLRRAFSALPSFGESGARPTLGLVSANNDRFLRLRWEVPEELREGRWVDYCKGGDYSKYYDDPHLLVDWRGDGKHIQESYGQAVRLRDPENYLSPGVNYPLVTILGMNARIMPAGCIFDNTAPTVLQDTPEDIWLHLAFVNTRTFEYLVRLLTSSRHWQVGYLRPVPFPPLPASAREELAELAKNCVSIRMAWDSHNETSHLFGWPLAAQVVCSLSAFLASEHEKWELLANELVAHAQRIDEVVALAFGFGDDFEDVLDAELSYNTLTYVRTSLPPNEESLPSVDTLMTMSPSIKADPRIIRALRMQKTKEARYDFRDDVSSIISYVVGCCVGRWDLNCALVSLPPSADAGALLNAMPSCPPGMLQGRDGLPLTFGCIPPDYPLRISWDGFLVDDAGLNDAQPHQDDIVRRTREVFDVLWKDKATEIDQEACYILNVPDLREYFRKPAGFFQDHLKRYSKSRRKAPIYWPLSTTSGSYTIWLYYHRLNDQTLYIAVNKYLEPKIAETERGMACLEEELTTTSGREATKLNDKVQETRAFLGELRELREELLRVAALPFRPDLNDGVIINAAPFHKLFRLRSWAKETEECWKKLEKGDYDWAHLAYVVWPERVCKASRTDRSIAIAHGLEELCE